LYYDSILSKRVNEPFVVVFTIVIHDDVTMHLVSKTHSHELEVISGANIPLKLTNRTPSIIKEVSFQNPTPTFKAKRRSFLKRGKFLNPLLEKRKVLFGDECVPAPNHHG
jgi:hypothetical protein